MLTVIIPRQSDQQPSSQAPSPAKDPVFCVNCTHIRHADKPAPFCAAVTTHVCLVRGPVHEYCLLARNEIGECGQDGRLFVAEALPVLHDRRSSDTQPVPEVHAAALASSLRTITFTTDHLVAIELALEARIVFIKQQIGYNSGDMHWIDALDVANQALELVQ